MEVLVSSSINDLRIDVNCHVKENMKKDMHEITGYLKDIKPVVLEPVTTAEQETLWDELVRTYHYLGYQKMIGQRIKYLIKSGEQVIGAISYNRAAKQVAAREAYIGWSNEGKKEQLKYVICNNRFLILPWVRVRYLASHVLSLSLKQVQKDWESRFGIRPKLAETFVDIRQYRGTCYKAAKWIYTGEKQRDTAKSGQLTSIMGTKRRSICMNWIMVSERNTRRSRNAK